MYHHEHHFIEQLPKCDLHLHLDGSVRLTTLIELADKAGVQLPFGDPIALKKHLFPDHYQDLRSYLQGFRLTCQVLQSATALERVAYEVACDSFAEGVRYIELRFAPQLHIHAELSFNEVVSAVDRGVSRACREANRTLDLQEPEHHYGIILIAIRALAAGYAPFYDNLSAQHPETDYRELASIASRQMVEQAILAREETKARIVAVDLAGDEAQGIAADHAQAFTLARRALLPVTIHAGEAAGWESILDAVAVLGAHRVGHALHLFDPEDDEDRKLRRDTLIEYLRRTTTTIEVCLTSNLQTSPQITSPAKHPLGRMIAEGLPVTMCTDNRLVSHTTVTDEIRRAATTFDLSPQAVRELVLHGFRAAFSPRSNRYIARVEAYCDAIFSRYQQRD